MSDIELTKYRQQLLDTLTTHPDDQESRTELLCADCLICEENIQDLGPSWRNTPYLKEILFHARLLLVPEHADLVYEVCRRAGRTISTHPRIKLQFLCLQREAWELIPNTEKEEESTEGQLEQDITHYQSNIAAADRGDFNQILPYGHLKHDPIEWSAAYEAVIDDAEKKVYDELQDFPRGMGFCHAYWHTLATVLLKDYGIRWQSPAVMNPRVMFD